MDWTEELDYDGEIEDPLEKAKEVAELRTSGKRKTVRRIDTPFPMFDYDSIGNMVFKKMSRFIKIPRQRNAYLREAFFKCYFSRFTDPEEDKKAEETLRIFGELFFYHQEIRIVTRLRFDRKNDRHIKKNKYLNLKENLSRLVMDGCKTISTMAIPKHDFKNYPQKDKFEDEEQYYLAAENFAKGTDHVKITFKPKKKDFPRPDELFLELAGKNAGPIKEKNGERFINLHERDHSTSNYISISGKLWTQAFALLVQDALEELEQEIKSDGVHYAYIPQLTIKAAIDHFNQNYPRAKYMSNNQKAYSISHRYKNKISDEPYKRDSILRALNRKEKSA